MNQKLKNSVTAVSISAAILLNSFNVFADVIPIEKVQEPVIGESNQISLPDLPSEGVKNTCHLIETALNLIDYTVDLIPAQSDPPIIKTHVTMLYTLDPQNNPDLKLLIEKKEAYEQDNSWSALSKDEADRLEAAYISFENAKAKYLTTEFSDAHLAARKSYDALSQKEQAQVENYCLLTDMETNIAYIMQSVNTIPQKRRESLPYPDRTCTVDYKPQSDFVDLKIEKTEPNDHSSNVNLIYTIKKGAYGNQVLTFNQLIDIYTNEYQMPGDSAEFTIQIRNESDKVYRYKPGSFTLTTADTRNMDQLLPVLGYDGQLLPLSYVSGIVTNKPLQKLFDTKQTTLTLEQYLNLYNQLQKKGYHSLSDYFLDYYNEKDNTSYSFFHEMILENPVSYEKLQSGNGNSFTITKDEAEQYQAEYPEMMNWAYVTEENGDNITIQFKWPEADLQAAGYNGFYQSMFSFAFGDDEIKELDPNKNHIFCHSHGVGDYMNGAELQTKTDSYFSAATAAEENYLTSNPNSVLTYHGKWALDGPCVRNAYALYDFNFYGSIILEDVTPNPVVPPVDPDKPIPPVHPDEPTSPSVNPNCPSQTDPDSNDSIPMIPLTEIEQSEDDNLENDNCSNTGTSPKDNPNTGESFPTAALSAAALSLGSIIILVRKKK